MTTFDSTTGAATAADEHEHAQQSQSPQQQPQQQPQVQSAAAAHAAGKQKAGHFLTVNAAIGDAFGSGNGERQSSTDLLARDMKTSSAASSAAPSRATSRATTPTFGALELGAVVMVESPQTSARSSTNSANGNSGLGSGQFEAKRPAPIVIVKDEGLAQAMSGPDGVLKIKALRTDGSARLDDDKEVPSVDIDSRLYAQSPHPSAIPILSRQSSKGYNLGTETSEVKLQTQGFDPMGLFSPTAAGHAQAMAVKARAVAIADLDAQGKHFDSRGRARTNSNAAAMAGKAKAVQKEAEDGGCRDCAGCTLM